MSEDSIPRIDVPEAYQARMNIGYGGIETGSDFLQKSMAYTDNQKKQLELEAGLLGVNPTADPDRFVEAHNALLGDLRAEVDAQLPGIKQTLIEKTAAYFGGDDDATKALLIELLERRLAATQQVIVADSLSTSKDSVGFFNGLARQPVMVSGELVLQLKESEDMDDFHDRLSKVILAHEVMHGMFTSGVQETWLSSSYTIRTGLEIFQLENPLDFMEMKTHKHGVWLNDATLESFRQTIMETRGVRYEPGVMVLHMLDKLSPGLRDKLVLAALDSSGPGPTFGEVEQLLGPTGIEEVEKLLVDVKNFADLEGFKDSVAAMLPKDLRERGRAIIEREQEEIFGWQPDYPQRRQKALDEAAAKAAAASS